MDYNALEITLPHELIPALTVVLCAVVLDMILGIFISIKNNEFEPSKIPDFMLKGVLPYIGGLIALFVVAKIVGLFYVQLFYFAAGTVLIKYGNDIKGKLIVLFQKK